MAKVFRTFEFTLLELLIVISIIAILAALLLPGLKKAKDAMLTSACLSNIRQINLGVRNYAIDFNGYLYASYDSIRSPGTWDRAVSELGYIPSAQKTLGRGCPAWREGAEPVSSNRYQYAQRYPGNAATEISAYYNTLASSYTIEYPNGTPLQVGPSKFVIHSESITWGPAWSRYSSWYSLYGNESPGGGNAYDLHLVKRQNNKANCVFMDGHGKGVNMSEADELGFDMDHCSFTLSPP